MKLLKAIGNVLTNLTTNLTLCVSFLTYSLSSFEAMGSVNLRTPLVLFSEVSNEV